MPGLNRKGPMNEGAMTGRGRGLCTGESLKPGQGLGAGMGLGRGRRCQGSGYGAGWGRNSGFAAASPDTSPTATIDSRAALQNRADMLEAEIAQIKQQLNRMPESSE